MAMNTEIATRYEIELDVIERHPELGEHDALELLRSEFRLAFNASHFIALSVDDPEVTIVSRTRPQEGIGRYELTFEFVPRRERSDEDAIALIHSEFQRALNASYFLHAFVDDPAIAIRPRELVADELRLAA
jgi:hypothetical protein